MANEPYSVLLTEATYFCGLCQMTHSYQASDEYSIHQDYMVGNKEWTYEREKQ